MYGMWYYDITLIFDLICCLFSLPFNFKLRQLLYIPSTIYSWCTFSFYAVLVVIEDLTIEIFGYKYYARTKDLTHVRASNVVKVVNPVDIRT